MGLPELRQAIADFYRERHGLTIDPKRIVITSGGSAALLLATALTVDSGDEVLIADPSYPCNRELVKSPPGGTGPGTLPPAPPPASTSPRNSSPNTIPTAPRRL